MDYFKNIGIDISSSIELLGDIETYNEILTDFYNELDDKITNLKEYKDNNDIENYTILVHGLKSECKYLSFYELANMCELHQKYGEVNDVNYINNNFEELMNKINEMKDIAGAYLKQL